MESATGQVIMDAQGRAIRIEWSNGVIFTRVLPEVQLAPMITNVIMGKKAGTENSSQSIDPNEVIVYEHADFIGDVRSWKLEPGMR